ESLTGDIIFKVPNLVIESLYVQQIQLMLLPEPRDRDDGEFAGKQVYQHGNMQPLCDFVEQRYFTVLNNRDYKWANELTVKTAFLTLLYNDILYIMDSEAEINRRYADLTMIIRPDKKYLQIFDVLIEFKFISLKKAKITAEDAKKLSKEQLFNMSVIRQSLENGEKQVIEYAQKLNDKFGNLRLKKFVVASLGFERICFKKIA
ncbi:MAG: hypothetical protein B6I31_02390, partial [Desulfobacteraceae bacterium 4572_19]